MYSDLIGKGCAQNGGDPLFIKSSYVHPQNKQTYPFYIMNRDGFSLLVMGFTGKEALEWKLQYIKAFNQMNEEEFDKEIKEKFKQVDAIIQIVSLLEEMLKTFGAKDKED